MKPKAWKSSAAGTLGGFLLLWLLLDRSAEGLGSFRGEWGLLVCALTVGAAMLVEMWLAGGTAREATKRLGLVRPSSPAIVVTLMLCAALLTFYPVHAMVTGSELSLKAGWLMLVPGLLAQGGLAEEVVFRGFLFRRLRAGTSFWRGALMSTPAFVAVHALLFLALDWPLALAALLTSLSLSFPLAKLFDWSGGSVWPPALLHFTVQGSIKLVEPGSDYAQLAVAWMAVSVIAPWLVFLIARVWRG